MKPIRQRCKTSSGAAHSSYRVEVKPQDVNFPPNQGLGRRSERWIELIGRMNKHQHEMNDLKRQKYLSEVDSEFNT